ncbi:hypothetical protein BH10PSE15_BH10PSE15_12070 [soil metagenome]
MLPHQPHFIGQPKDVQVFWGYGLFVGKPGNFVPKAMADCTGREIMTEIIGHLGAAVHTANLLEGTRCIPCMMPFITSQFLRREHGDTLSWLARRFGPAFVLPTLAANEVRDSAAYDNQPEARAQGLPELSGH